MAAGQLVIIDGNGRVVIDVLAAASDPDGDRLRIIDLTLPAHGRLELNADQTLTYTPGASFTDHDSFGYRIRDLRAAGDGQVGHAEAQVTLRRPPVVVPPKLPPIAGPDRERLHDNRILRQAADDRCSRRFTTLRADRLAFLVYDHRGDAPEPDEMLADATRVRRRRAHDDRMLRQAAVDQCSRRSTTLRADRLAFLAYGHPEGAPDPEPGPEQEPDGEPPLRVVALALPQHGLIGLNPDQTVTYTPESGFTGIDDFTYVIEDARGGTARGVVSIQVEE